MVQFEYTRVMHLLVSLTFDTFERRFGVHFPAWRKRALTLYYTPEVKEVKGCMTLGDSNWTICSPQNLFSRSKFPLFKDPDSAFPFPACRLPSRGPRAAWRPQRGQFQFLGLVIFWKILQGYRLCSIHLCSRISSLSHFETSGWCSEQRTHFWAFR